MPLKFRKILPLAKGLKLNMSKSGLSLSLGKKGSAINIGTKGIRASIGKVGSGLGYSEYTSYKKRKFNFGFFVVIALVFVVWIFFN